MAIKGATDFATSLYKNTSGKILHLLLDTIASRVGMEDGRTVETAIAETAALAQNGVFLAQNASAYAADVEVMATNALARGETAIEAAANAQAKADAGYALAQTVVPNSVGELLAYENSKLNAVLQAPNSREIITVSGNWIAKVDGYHRVTCIAGGDGGSYEGSFSLYVLRSGRSGAIVDDFIFLEKGQVVPVVIGAGGGHGEIDRTLYPLVADLVAGGQTSFGSLVAPKVISGFPSKFYSGEIKVETSRVSCYTIGGGLGAVLNGTPFFYGTGGSANFDGNPSRFSTYPGVQGCVIVEFFNPDKTGNE